MGRSRGVRLYMMLGLLGIATCGSGCVHVRNGLYNFLDDATDIVRFDVSGSFGTDMGAHVMLTKFVQVKSYSYEDLYRAGYAGRMFGLWEEERQDLWIGPEPVGNVKIKSDGVWMKTCSSSLPGAMKQAGTGWMMESEDEFGLGVHLFVIGARVGVRPLEILDMLTTPFGLDLRNDSTTWRQRRAMRDAMRKARELQKQKQEEKKKEKQNEGAAPPT